MDLRFDMSADAPELYAALSNVSKALEHAGLPGGLNHLIDLRVSQLNGCAYCIGLHTSWALRDGERRERLEAVADWRDSALFTPDERAAFAWAEALTQRQHAALDGLHADLGQHFDRAQIAALTMAVATINAWNRVGIATHRETVPAMAAE